MGFGKPNRNGAAAPSPKSRASSSSNSLPREDTPLLSTNLHVHTSSQSKTFANVFIAIVGAGVLGLPYTFMRTGWVTCLLMIFAVAALTYHGMMLLIKTRNKLEDSPSCDFAKIASFGDLGFAVCGHPGRLAVDLMIVLSQAGFCVGYLIFIGNTLANLFNSSVSVSVSSVPMIWGVSAKSLYIWGGFPFQLGLNAIPSLTLLAPLSIFADIVDLIAMAVVMVQDVLIFAKGLPVLQAFGTFSTFFYGLGVAVYSFEGVGMALPLEAEMKDKSKFPRILALTMFFIALMYGSFGLLGYFAFGPGTKDIITANMGKGLLSSIVQLGLCINLFFTFPLMMNPVYEVFERTFWCGRYCLWMRWMLVLAVSLVALFVPNFADFLSLVGSSTCCVLGFVLPALFHYLTFKDEMSWRRASPDLCMMFLGILVGVTGTWYSLEAIFSVKSFKCSSSGKTCDAAVDYIPCNATMFLDVKNLFDVSSLVALRGANNLPLSYLRNSTLAANEKIRIPFRCACNNGRGLSDRQPMSKVAANDSLYSVAAEVFAGLVTYQQLQEANNISDPGLIKLGYFLRIPLPCSCDDVEGQDVMHYGHVVAPGATLGGIAQQYNVSQGTLLAFNDLGNARDLKAGAVLDVPLRVCTSMVSNASLDYPLLLPSDTYARTATECIMCNCSAANNWVLQCKPSSANTSCSPIRCVGEEDNLYIGDTASSGCNHTTCAYAGYTENHILTAIALESTCPASSDESPNGSSARELKFSLLVSIYEVVFYLVVFWCI